MPDLAAFADRRVTFQRLAPAADEFRAGGSDWETLATERAEVRAVSDRERFAAGEMRAEITHRVKCHRTPALADLGGADRVMIDGAAHDIQGVKEIEGRRFLEITTRVRAD